MKVYTWKGDNGLTNTRNSDLLQPERTREITHTHTHQRKGRRRNTPFSYHLTAIQKGTMHNSACPKCGASFSGSTKSCGSCGAVSYYQMLSFSLFSFPFPSPLVYSSLSLFQSPAPKIKPRINTLGTSVASSEC